MKEKFFLPAILILLSSFSFFESIYSISFKDIGGETINLFNYKNRKILFVIVPLSSQDTTISLAELSLIQKKYDTSLTIIGVPAEESGFKKGDGDKLKKLYKDMGSSFILAEGMKVKKGNAQSTLLLWLTKKEKNRHFDMDAKGIGQKFFVDERGELYAVLGPEIKLSNAVIDKILSRKMR